MARPKKDPSIVKGEIVRIPVSADEKTRMYEAAGGEFARWARDILLKAADDYHASHGPSGKRPSRRTNEAQQQKKAVASALG
jgi:hypothetical protein